MAQVNTSEIEKTLTQWGIWARTGNGIKVQHHSINIIGRLMIDQGKKDPWATEEDSRPAVTISDDEAERVDRIVSRLIQKDREAGEMVTSVYLLGASTATASEHLKINRKRGAKSLDRGVGYVDGVLDGLRLEVA